MIIFYSPVSGRQTNIEYTIKEEK